MIQGWKQLVIVGYLFHSHPHKIAMDMAPFIWAFHGPNGDRLRLIHPL